MSILTQQQRNTLQRGSEFAREATRCVMTIRNQCDGEYQDKLSRIMVDMEAARYSLSLFLQDDGRKRYEQKESGGGDAGCPAPAEWVLAHADNQASAEEATADSAAEAAL